MTHHSPHEILVLVDAEVLLDIFGEGWDGNMPPEDIAKLFVEWLEKRGAHFYTAPESVPEEEVVVKAILSAISLKKNIVVIGRMPDGE